MGGFSVQNSSLAERTAGGTEERIRDATSKTWQGLCPSSGNMRRGADRWAGEVEKVEQPYLGGSQRGCYSLWTGSLGGVCGIAWSGYPRRAALWGF
jgi:hypothetical protein